jgi:katanin p60 ATPase-containing subunit A1
MVRKKLCPALPSGSPPTLIPHAAPDVDFPDIARQLEGYSGSDIALLCKEAAMRPVRRLMSRLEALEATAKDGVVSSDLIKLDAVDAADVRAALEVTKPSARLVATKYEAWQAEFASS